MTAIMQEESLLLAFRGLEILCQYKYTATCFLIQQ